MSLTRMFTTVGQEQVTRGDSDPTDGHQGTDARSKGGRLRTVARVRRAEPDGTVNGCTAKGNNFWQVMVALGLMAVLVVIAFWADGRMQWNE